MNTVAGLQLADIRAAALRLQGIAHQTPALHSPALDELAHNIVVLKCENLQRAGAFKFRGAYNRLAQLTDEERSRGVVAYSSGNHAQGVALAARLLGINATIVMPTTASRVKLEATRGYGAEVVTYDPTTQSREQLAQEISRASGAVLVPPFDDYRVMAGQGTLVPELFEEAPNLDALLVPLGGGGLLSGCAVAAKSLQPSISVYGVEPEGGDDWHRSWTAGKRVTLETVHTIADGLRTTEPGELTWPIVHALATDILTVSDEEIRIAMRVLGERSKIIVEPSGAVGVAALLAGKLAIRGKRVGVVISGGNVDLDRYCRLLSPEREVA